MKPLIIPRLTNRVAPMGGIHITSSGDYAVTWKDMRDDPKFYTARTKRAVNSLTVERGPKGGAA